MHPLGHGLTTSGIGPVYSVPLYLQRRYGIGNFFGSIFRWVRPLIWSRLKAMGRGTLCTVGKILSDIAAHKSTDDVSAGDFVSKHVTESAQNLICNLRGRGMKRARETAVGKKRSNKKCPKSRDIHRIKRVPRKI